MSAKLKAMAWRTQVEDQYFVCPSGSKKGFWVSEVGEEVPSFFKREDALRRESNGRWKLVELTGVLAKYAEDPREVLYPRRWRVPYQEAVFVLEGPDQTGFWESPRGKTLEDSDFTLRDALKYEKEDGWVEIKRAEATPDASPSKLAEIVKEVIFDDVDQPLSREDRMALSCIKTLIAEETLEGKTWNAKRLAERARELAKELAQAPA